jgi:hypothetical protein
MSHRWNPLAWLNSGDSWHSWHGLGMAQLWNPPWFNIEIQNPLKKPTLRTSWMALRTLKPSWPNPWNTIGMAKLYKPNSMAQPWELWDPLTQLNPVVTSLPWLIYVVTPLTWLCPWNFGTHWINPALENCSTLNLWLNSGSLEPWNPSKYPILGTLLAYSSTT